MPAAPVTSSRIGAIRSSARAAAGWRGRAQPRARSASDELEARLGVLEALAEQVAELAHAVADGLRVHADRGRDGLDLARAVEPRGERLLEPGARAGGELVERREPARGEVGGHVGRGREQQVREVLLGDEQAPRRGRAGRRAASRCVWRARRALAAASVHGTVGPSATGWSSAADSSRRRQPGASGSGITTSAAPAASAPIAPSPSRRAKRAAIESSSASPGSPCSAVAATSAATPPRGASSRRRPRPCGSPPGSGAAPAQQPHEPPPAALALAGRGALLLGVALGRLRGQLVDVGEDRLAERVDASAAARPRPRPRRTAARRAGRRRGRRRAARRASGRRGTRRGRGRRRCARSRRAGAPAAARRSRNRLNAISTPSRTTWPNSPSIARA